MAVLPERMCINKSYACPMPAEARREHWVLLDLGYRWLWAAMSLLEIEPQTSGRTASVLSESSA